VIVLQLLILGFLIYVIYILSYSLIFGAPYASIGKRRMSDMIELLDPQKGKKLADLGSGDGRIVIEASKRGLESHGFEINPILFLVSKIKQRRAKLSKTDIHRADYWQNDLSSFDYITIYATQHMVNRMEKKLLQELRPGSKVVSNHYKFPNWKTAREKNDIFLYIKE